MYHILVGIIIFYLLKKVTRMFESIHLDFLLFVLLLLLRGGGKESGWLG